MCLVLQLVWHTNDPSLLNEHIKRLVKVRISLVFRRFLLYARKRERERERERERVWSDPYFIPVISRRRANTMFRLPKTSTLQTVHNYVPQLKVSKLES